MVLFDSFKTERGCPVKLAICKMWISSYPFLNGCQGNLNLWCNGIFPWGFQMACGGASCVSCGIESPYSHSAPLPRTLCTSPASNEAGVNTRTADPYQESYRWSWYQTEGEAKSTEMQTCTVLCLLSLSLKWGIWGRMTKWWAIYKYRLLGIIGTWLIKKATHSLKQIFKSRA